MDTKEHTELGNAVQLADWIELENNPYLDLDDNGVLFLNLQSIDENGLPQPIALNVSSGVIVAMSGDYFGGKEVDLKLPTINEFKCNKQVFDPANECEHLGEYLIQEPVKLMEEYQFIKSYMRLASHHVTTKEIDTIYAINQATYISYSETLNSYAKELMFALKVKNYGEMLNRNLSHFTPWSVRAYVLGHSLGLKYARMYYELKKFQADPHYHSENPEFNRLLNVLKDNNEGPSTTFIGDMAYRYQALALSMELFSFHYYTDHFAAGHGALIGDLRCLLPKRFGFLGGILVNSLHDELNSITIYTKRPYDPKPNINEPPLEAGGDGDFDSQKNYYNKLACLEGMNNSLKDIREVFQGKSIPGQKQYGGLGNMPDLDINYRQPQPLIVLGKNNEIYYRTNLAKIRILSPSQLRAAYNSPLEHGYTQLTNSFEAFILVVKLRIFTYFFSGILQSLSTKELKEIEEEERLLNPGRQPIAQLPAPLIRENKSTFIPHWKTPASNQTILSGLKRNGFMHQANMRQEVAIVSDQGIAISTVC
ncbi:MAG: hypothetical protein PSV35_04400 [bacterium]|nr:hypothetical protein [bacterium]